MRGQDLKWLKFGKLVCTWNHFTKKIEWKKTRYRRYEECICECWKIKYCIREDLLNWHIKSCGCLVKEIAKRLGKSHTTHSLSKTPFYRKYNAITQRCNNKNNDNYELYWWRWIKCEWKTFEEFKNDMYDSYLEFSKTHKQRDVTIDRIDVNWNYCKENCRWVTMKKQWQNRRNNLSVMYKWVHYHSLSELCNKLNLNYRIINKRIWRWMCVEKAIEQKRRNYPLHINI